MAKRIPILLCYYALSNGTETLLFGQVAFTKLKDLSFTDYSRRKTFRTLLSLYRARPYAGHEVVLTFDKSEVKVKTDAHGSFYLRTKAVHAESILIKTTIRNGEEARLIEGLYERSIHVVSADTIVISDIDDTLIHSFIYRKLMKFRTLMFTTVEKRKAVVNMQELINRFTASGAESIYLSNSEMNLYPMIYRFLFYNNFPKGPLFLKKLRNLWHVLWNIKFPIKDIHKQSTLEDLLSLFPGKKFVLMGDNTQHDLSIYLSVVAKHGNCIQYIIIRKVVDRSDDQRLINKHLDKLDEKNIKLFYSDTFPAIA